MVRSTKKNSGNRKARQGAGTPTARDVARMASVSTMTVSRVVNGAANVNADKRDQVMKAIEALGYVPNRAARSLAGARLVRIALVYDNPSAAYLSELLVGAIEAAAECDADLIVEHAAGMQFVDIADKLVRHRIDAVLLPPPLCEEAVLLDSLLEKGLPILQLATGCPHDAAYSISIDDRAAATAITERLIELGHRRIGFISGDTNQSASMLRRSGYEMAMKEAGLPINPALIVAGDYTYRSGVRAAEQLLSLADRPSAIFASNDDMASAVLAVASRNKIAVPEMLSVCGFDDTVMATNVWPELTTIRQPVAEMARTAIATLVSAVRNSDDIAQHMVVDHRLVVRASDAGVQ